MKLATTVVTAVGVLAIAGGTILAVAGGKGSLCSKDAGACDPAECKSEAKTVAVTKPHGKVLITCCDTCAEKLRKNPRRFVRA